MLAAARNFAAETLPRPNLDFGCMDGLNSYLLLGGKPPFDFDVFEHVSLSPKMHLKASLKDDYYESSPAMNVSNLSPVARPFTVGLDWKDSHIEKARQFGAHDSFRLEPVDSVMGGTGSDSLSGIWAPNLYWMQDVSAVLSEFWRVTRPSGKIITIVPDRNLIETMVNRHADRIDSNWLGYLDRGRYENASRSARTLSEWLGVFEASKMDVTRHETFLPAAINQVYEIGFRPMFGPLLHMRSSLASLGRDELLKVKKLWVDRLIELTHPLLDLNIMRDLDDRMLWHIFELQPKKL